MVIYDPDDHDGEGPSPTEPRQEHYDALSQARSRTSRRIKFTVTADVEVEVVEPPRVHDVEVKSIAKQIVFRALQRMEIGVPTGINVEVTRFSRKAQDE